MRPSELQNSGVEVNGIVLFTKKNLSASSRRGSLFEKEATVIDPRYCNTISRTQTFEHQVFGLKTSLLIPSTRY